MNISKEFVEHIEASCIPDESTGKLVCKMCGYTVNVDWFEQTLECSGCDGV